jgi:hypothetical protein
MAEHPFLDPILPHHAKRGQYVPAAGGRLTVTLPGENVTSTVTSVKSRDVVICKLTGPVFGFGRLHSYRSGETVAVRRAVDQFGIEIWEVITERMVRMEEDAQRLAEQEAEARRVPPEAQPVPVEIAVDPSTKAQEKPVPKKRKARAKKVAA